MPFPYTLPTTSAFSFSSTYTSPSHPSLPLTASTHRAVVRDALKKHKRLPIQSQAPNVPTVVSALTSYLPYLFAINAGLRDESTAGLHVSPTSATPPSLAWRPTLSDTAVGIEAPRAKISDLEHEIAFVLVTLASCHTLLARSTLHPLYVTSSAAPDAAQRAAAINAASRHLIDATVLYEYADSRADAASPPPCADIAPSTIRGLASLSLAEATLLVMLKDDPYTAIVAQDRNRVDNEWMFRAPSIPKVRVHMLTRLCLAAGEHAARAAALFRACPVGKVNTEIIQYADDLRRTARARACRLSGIDAEDEGQVGLAIAWLNAGLGELGIEREEAVSRGSGFRRLRREWSERREDRRVERGGTAWGVDGGKAEEGRVLRMLSEKWNRINDTVNTQSIPPSGPLIAMMPSGREFYNGRQPFKPPVLESNELDAMRAPPDRGDDFGDVQSSDDEITVVGAYPEVGRNSSAGYY